MWGHMVPCDSHLWCRGVSLFKKHALHCCCCTGRWPGATQWYALIPCALKVVLRLWSQLLHALFGLSAAGLALCGKPAKTLPRDSADAQLLRSALQTSQHSAVLRRGRRRR